MFALCCSLSCIRLNIMKVLIWLCVAFVVCIHTTVKTDGYITISTVWQHREEYFVKYQEEEDRTNNWNTNNIARARIVYTQDSSSLQPTISVFSGPADNIVGGVIIKLFLLTQIASVTAIHFDTCNIWIIWKIFQLSTCAHLHHVVIIRCLWMDQKGWKLHI